VTLSDFNPIAHWTCDETSGTRYDSTANGRDLTDNNTVASDVGLLNNACLFNRSNNESLSLAHASFLDYDGATNLGVSLWYNSTYLTGTIGIMGVYDSNNWLVYTNDTSQRILSRDQGTLASLQTSVTTSTWYHVFVQYRNNNQVDLWVNGSYVASQSAGAGTPDNATFRLGAYGSTATGFFSGKIDEASLFTGILSTSTIESIYNGGTPLCYDCSPATSTPTSTATTTVDMSDTNFLLVVVIFFLTFIFLGLAFSPLNRKK